MEPETRSYDDGDGALKAQRGRSSAIDEATRHLSERIDLLHKRLDELGTILQPYCRPSHEPEDGNTVVRDRDVSSSYREELDTLASRVQAANQRVDNFIEHVEL